MSWFKKKKKPQPGIIPFDFYKGVPIIEVKLNGRKARLLIDSGASLNILSREAKEKYGFSTYTIKGYDVAGIGGSKVLGGVRNADVEYDNICLNIPFRAMSLKAVQYKLNIVGIIGSKYLNRHGYVIDYKSKTIFIK